MTARMTITHYVKSVNPYFKQYEEGELCFMMVFDDQDYLVGDSLVIREVAFNKPTGKEVDRRIKYILRRFNGLQKGYVVLGLES